MACSPGPGTGDDAGPGDAGVTGEDVATDTVGAVPGPSGVNEALCARAIDLNSAGTLEGDTITIRGSTYEPTDVLQGPCNPVNTGHQIYRYTVRGENVWLRISTNHPGGTPYLDTLLWVLDDRCAEDAPVHDCNDDDFTADGETAGASTLLTRSRARGTVLYIVVATYANARRGATARGDFTLTVTETPSASLDQQCDSSIPGGCVRGLVCAASSMTSGVCVHPRDEVEPNDTPSTAGELIVPGRGTAIRAAIDPAGDVDCFAVRIEEGQSLYIEANDGGGLCRADLKAEVYRVGEPEPFEGDDDSGRATDVACPRVDPMENTGVRAMRAGTYSVCVMISMPDHVEPMVTVPLYFVHLATR